MLHFWGDALGQLMSAFSTHSSASACSRWPSPSCAKMMPFNVYKELKRTRTSPSASSWPR